jgi:hypothetical protein
MPQGGPTFLSDPNYTVTVKGQVMTSADIRANIEWWLRNGMPEN